MGGTVRSRCMSLSFSLEPCSHYGKMHCEVEVCLSARQCASQSRKMILEGAAKTTDSAMGSMSCSWPLLLALQILPFEKKNEGGAVILEGLLRGSVPFPPQKKKRERGRGLDAPFVWLLPWLHSTPSVLAVIRSHMWITSRLIRLWEREGEDGRTRRTICMAFALIALDSFSSDTTGCCSLTHVNYILSHTSHFPGETKTKKRRDENMHEWCCVPSLTHMHSQSWGSAVDALNATYSTPSTWPSCAFDLGFCPLCSCLGFISNMVASRCSTFAPERLIGIFWVRRWNLSRLPCVQSIV